MMVCEPYSAFIYPYCIDEIAVEIITVYDVISVIVSYGHV